MLYQLQFSYISEYETIIKEVIYQANSDVESLRDALVFINTFGQSLDHKDLSCRPVHLKIKEYIANIIDEQGNLIIPVTKTVMSWNCKDYKTMMDYIKKIDNDESI